MSVANQQQRIVYLSGAMVPESEAKISIFDSAVMLGDSLTESTRTFGHKPFRLDEHLTRLYRSLKVSRVDPGLSPAEMKRVTLDLLEANQSLMGPNDDCWIVHNHHDLYGADGLARVGSVLHGRLPRCDIDQSRGTGTIIGCPYQKSQSIVLYAG